jgi:dipeptidyl aminopeptidase/acylaminoacyl peptidase
MTMRRRWVWAVIAAMAAVLLLCFAGGAVLCESALRVPRKPATPAPAGVAQWRPVQINARDGIVLKAWLLSPEIDNGNCILTLHGIGDSRSGTAALARLFVDNHYKVLMPDSRGHGESGGEMVTYGLLEARDIRSWVDWLIAAEHPRNIFAMGESFGAAVLLQSLSVEPRFSGVVAECPFANFKAIAEYRVAQRLPIAAPLVWSGFLYARWKYGVDFNAASPEAAVGATSTPVLLIHGLDDKNTPPLHSQLIASRHRPNLDLWLEPAAGPPGAFQSAPGEFRNRVLSWLSNHS